MFAQVIVGRVAAPGELEQSMRRWAAHLAPRVAGWHGGGGGITADGDFVGVALFASPEAARHHSDRADQHQWWMETAKTFHAEPRFHDCDRPVPLLAGPVAAGHLCVLHGHTRAPERVRELCADRGVGPRLAAARPDLRGGLWCVGDDGTAHLALYLAAPLSAGTDPWPGVSAALGRYEALVSPQACYGVPRPWYFPGGPPAAAGGRGVPALWGADGA
ncbi:MAG TPA: hypothetical protein VFY17_09090 [Pilimelia sp.]|nr:hypothetical protein [Pilimelia sp.]